MRINTEMQFILSELSAAEGRRMASIVRLPANELGNELIKLYYSREDVQRRELIREFMNQAGVVWLRKLLTRDVRPIASSQAPFASLNDYVQLLAANDEAAVLLSQA